LALQLLLYFGQLSRPVPVAPQGMADPAGKVSERYELVK
jgi:hypothetical protein